MVFGAVLGVDSRRVAGYEYHYRFSIDDEIAPLYKFEFHHGQKTYLFEIRTNFIIKTIGGQDQIMDSERFDAVVYGDSEDGCLMACVEDRLVEYWMTNDEISMFVQETLDFAVQSANENQRLIPVVVNLEVCTVQQENETVDSVNDRALRQEKLVPLVIWAPYATCVDREQYDQNLLFYLSDLMIGSPRIGEAEPSKASVRVEDVEDGLTVMPLCDICLRGPMLGNFISVLPTCNHVFHSHCIARRMLGENYLCPTCQVPAYPYSFCLGY